MKTSSTWTFTPRQILGWTLFTLAAGFANATAVMACGSYVTHVTGSVSNIGLEEELATDYAIVVALFVGGAAIAFLLAETLRRQRALAFALPILLSFGVLVVTTMEGGAGRFGEFGGDPEDGALGLIGPLVVAMGMLNASIAAATQNRVRVTHLTGPATDLAGNLVRAVLDGGEGAAVEARWAALRLAKLLSFALGAYTAARVSEHLGWDTFALGGVILIVALGLVGAPDAPPTAATSEREPGPVRYEDHMPPLSDDRATPSVVRVASASARSSRRP